MFKKFAIAAALAIASCAATASSDVDDATPPYRRYVGADCGVTHVASAASHRHSCGAFSGYRFSPYIAVEAGARRLYRTGPRIDGDNNRSHLDQFAMSAVGSMALPVNYDVSVFGRVGVNRVSLSVTEYGSDDASRERVTRGLYGIGIAASLGPYLSARLELQKPTSKLTNLSYGLFLKF